MIRTSKLRRLRARSRGFSHLSTTLEAAAIMGWFAVAVASEKRLDNAVIARRAAESSAQDTVHGSAGACASQPVDHTLGDVRPKATVQIDESPTLGLQESALPSIAALGWQNGQAFPSQKAPIKQAKVSARATSEGDDGTGGGNFAGTRNLTCMEKPPKSNSPTAAVSPLRQKLWEQNLKGY